MAFVFKLEPSLAHSNIQLVTLGFEEYFATKNCALERIFGLYLPSMRSSLFELNLFCLKDLL